MSTGNLGKRLEKNMKKLSEADLFTERYMMLNPEQRRAVDTTEGPVMVIAGPGTGKTEILTMRIANILRGGGGGENGAAAAVRPEQILALTFTEAGAITMRRRLAALVGQKAYRVVISTFHGFANGIIRDYPDYFPDIVGAVSITEIDQVRILRGLLDSEHLKELRPFGDRYYYLTKVLSAINKLKQEGVTPEGLDTIIVREKSLFDKIDDLIWDKGAHKGKMKGKYAEQLKHINRNREVAQLYGAYQRELRKAKQYDYSDMIMQVAAAFETYPDLLEALQDRFHYFLIDEHQDTNDAQNRIIEFLVGSHGKNSDVESPNLFVVGDEKQAIYRFQGASLENFLYFRKKFSNVVLIPLISNYRSVQAILDAAEAVSPRENRLIAGSRNGDKNLGEAKDSGSPAELAVLSSPDVEYYFIAHRIKELLKGAHGKTVPPEEIAVLYRDNRDVVPLVRVLEKEGIPFNIESDQDILNDEDMQKLLKILRVVEEMGKRGSMSFDEKLFEAMHVDFLNIEPIDIYHVSTYARKNRLPLLDVLRSEKLLDAARVTTEKMKEACLALANNLTNWERYVKNRPAVDAFEAIVRESGFLAVLLAHPSATEKIMKLHAFFDLLKSLVERDRSYTLGKFFGYLDLMIEHDVALKASGAVRLPGRIRLMTAHRSKGLEFEYVIIMNAFAGKWGARTRRESIKLPKAIYRIMESEEGEENDENDFADDSDERNVFYVALTRAKRQVTVTYSATNRDGREQLATPFIAELEANIFTIAEDIDAIEKLFLTHPEIEFAAPPEKAPELADRAFVNELFENQGLSVTALNNYLECPWQYFYRNLVRIPEAPNKHLCFGTAVHAALRDYFECLAQGEDRGKEYLIKRFEETLSTEPIAETDYEETLEKGRVALAGWYTEYKGTWNPKTITERRVENVVVGDVPVNGMVDKIEFAAVVASQSNVVVDVVDYKTGEPKSRNVIEGKTAASNGNYKRQLVFYKLLLDAQGEYNMRSGTIDFIEPDEKGRYHRELFEVVPAELTELRETIARVADEIRTLAFWNRTCDREDCAYCALRKSF
jgi:DNA helicase-2/ATP-dependent DNA helicase PcrA